MGLFPAYSEWASFSNNLLSMGGFTGSIGFARDFVCQNNRTISQAAMSSFEVSVSSFERLQKGLVDLSPTIERIQKGIKFPHRNDGIVFKNREGLLPKKHGSYYREYVYLTPGVEGAGPRRIIVGENGELFYSSDHYQTFFQIK